MVNKIVSTNGRSQFEVEFVWCTYTGSDTWLPLTVRV